MKSMRDFMNVVRIDELSTELVQKAQAKRHKQLVDKSDVGKARNGGFKPGDKPTKASIDNFHDTQNATIDRDHREGSKKFHKPVDQELVKKQKADNERERGRNMKRGAAINAANKKLNGTARVPATPKK